jgi:iron(III) transport system substrate-binding protein
MRIERRGQVSRRNFCVAILLFIDLSMAAQGSNPSGNLFIYCPHPVDFVNPIIQEFEIETGIKVEVKSAGTGELMRLIESEKGSPKADVVWGGSRASLDPHKAYFDPYRSANRTAIFPRFLDPDDAYTPFTLIPTVFMYNKNLCQAGFPRSWADLLDPKWRSRIAFADPSLSSSSFEALVNMLFAMGSGEVNSGWGYVEDFVGNLGSDLLGSSSDVYKGVANGEYAIAVTFEEAAANYRRQGAPVDIAYPTEGTIMEPDGVAVLQGAKNRDNARRFVDFVTSRKVQAKIAKDLNRRSVRTDVPPAAGLIGVEEIRVIRGDYYWAGHNKEAILSRFKNILIKR